MDIKLISAYDHPQEISELFSEYTDMLIAGDSSFKQYLKIQHYDDEIKNLESKYGQPYGRLYIAYCEGAPAGCIGLRTIDDRNCEMKRLYVRPGFRGKNIGKQLIRRIIEDAKGIGYAHMLLDTLPFLESALHLYKGFGFYEIESYNDSPVSASIYMRLDLQEERMMRKMKIKKINGDFTVCKVTDYTQVNLDAEYCFTGKTDEEKSLVCLTSDTPSNTVEKEDGWRAFRIEGILDFSLVGILSKISAILAEAGIGIFAVSTFNTDYVLVKKENEQAALDRLADEGYEIQG